MPIDNKTLLRVRSIVGAGGGGEGGEAVIRSLSITENGTYTAPSGVDGYSPVTVNVPEPTGTKTITSNGTHDVAAYASAQVNVPDVPAVTESLTVTENGTYTPASGVDGFNSVTVDVAGSGGAFGVETGSYIPAASVSGFTIRHSLGVIPKCVIVYTDSVDQLLESASMSIASIFSVLHETSDGSTYVSKLATGKGNASWTKLDDIYHGFVAGAHDALIGVNKACGVERATASEVELAVKNGSGFSAYFFGGVEYKWLLWG